MMLTLAPLRATLQACYKLCFAILLYLLSPRSLTICEFSVIGTTINMRLGPLFCTGANPTENHVLAVVK